MALIAALLSIAAAESQVCPRVAFGPPVDYAAEDSPIYVTAGDLNRDGLQDLIVETAGGNELLVFLGTGAGTFGPPSRYIVGPGPNSVVVADFNADGIPDIASANRGSSTVTVLLGNGDGSFGPPASFSLPAGSGPSSIVAGDFNLDSHLDLATADSGGSDVTVLLGNGDGTFGNASSYTVGTGPVAIAAGDLNGDGRLDLVTADEGSGSVTVLLGVGGGAALFGTGVAAIYSGNPASVAVGDFNGDGKLDLAIADWWFHSVAVMAGWGNGTFHAATQFATPSTPMWLVAADLDGDGRTDIACIGTTPPALSVYLNTSQALPDATITLPQGVCANSTGNSASVPDAGNDAAYAWSVSNGTITGGSGTRQVTFTAGAPGFVRFQVDITDATGCSSFGASSVLVDSLPATVTITSPSAVCPNSTLHRAFVQVGGPGTTYTWTIANGAITSGLGTQTIMYSAGPSGVVTLGVSVQTPSGCIAGGSVDVPIQQAPAVTLTAPASVCAGSSGNVASASDAGPGMTYSWRATNGSISGDPHSRQVQFSASSLGGTVGLQVDVATSAGCVHSSSKTVPIAGSSVITGPSEVCPNASGLVASVPDSGAEATYTWTVTGGTVTAGAGTRQVTFTSANSGTVAINVTVQTTSGCSSRSALFVPIKAGPSAVIGTASPVCAKSTGNAASVPDAGSGATYSWTMTNGTITAGAGTPQVTFSVGDVGTTVLTVTVQDPGGCSRTGNTSVNVTAPSASIVAPAATCANSGSNFAWVADAGNGATYAWSISNGTITAGGGTNQITFSVGTSGPVSLAVTVQTASGCAASGTLNVPVAPLPSTVITAPAAVCVGSSGNIASVADAGAGATYAWIIANGNITAGSSTRQITFSAGVVGTTAIGVWVQTAGGCEGSAGVDLAVNPLPSAVIAAPAATCAGSGGNVASVADAGAGASYAWTIANGTITAGNGTRAVTFTAGASGQVGLAVAVQSAAGCAASGSQSVAVTPPPLAAIAVPAGVCGGSSGNLASVPDAGAGATYRWGIVNGSITGGAGTDSITFTAGQSGLVGLGVLVQSAIGCKSAGVQVVPVEPLPSAAITAPSSVRHNSSGNVASVPDAGQGATYAWAITDGTVTGGAGTKRVVFQAGTRGTLTLSVTVTRATGCESAGSRNVSVN